MLALSVILLATQTASPALSLDQAIALALPRAPALRAAQVEVELAELQSRRAQLQRLRFKVDGQLAELWTKTNIGGDRGDSSSGALGLSNLSANLEVPLFTGFRVEAGIGRAEALERASAEALKAQRRQLSLQVARVYWTVRKLGLLVEVEVHTLERFRSAESVARARVQSGLAPPPDATRAEARRRLEEVILADLQGQLRESEAELSVLLGINAPHQLVDAPRLGPVAEPISELLATAQRERPELARDRARNEAQAFAIEQAESGFYPTLSVSSLLQYGNNPFVAGAGARAVFGSADPFAGMAADLQLGAVLSFNIFDTWATQTAVDEAQASARLEAQALAQSGQQVEAEVRTTDARLRRQLELVERLLGAEAVSTETVTLLERRYQAGESSILELLDAELERAELDRRRVAALADGSLARLELEAALGRTLGVEE